jgi:hypothetical protein
MWCVLLKLLDWAKRITYDMDTVSEAKKWAYCGVCDVRRDLMLLTRSTTTARTPYEWYPVDSLHGGTTELENGVQTALTMSVLGG